MSKGRWRPALVLSCLMFAAALTAPAGAQMRISHQWAPEIDARDRAARVFVAEVAKRLPRRPITIHPNSSLKIDPVQQYDAMLDGRIEMAIFPMFYVSPRIPELSITLLPGVPATVEAAQLLKNSDFHRRFQQFCESKGIHVLTWWWLTGGIVSTEEEIGGPEQMKGLRVRSGDPTFDEMFKALGAEAQIMPSTQIGPSLAEGKLDLALASLESLVSLKIYEPAKSAVVGGDALYVSLHPLMISMRAWATLSEAEQKAFTEAADVADGVLVDSQREAEAQALSTFVKAGIKVRRMQFDEYENWLQIANETAWRAYQAKSETANALFRSMLQSFIDSDRRGKEK